MEGLRGKERRGLVVSLDFLWVVSYLEQFLHFSYMSILSSFLYNADLGSHPANEYIAAGLAGLWGICSRG